jgi:hypothetical protein
MNLTQNRSQSLVFLELAASFRWLNGLDAKTEIVSLPIFCIAPAILTCTSKSHSATSNLVAAFLLFIDDFEEPQTWLAVPENTSTA